MNIPKDHLRHVLLDYFLSGYNATNAYDHIKAVYGDGVITPRSCQRWYQKFKSGDTSLKDLPRSGRNVTLDDTSLVALLNENNSVSLKQIAKKLDSSTSTVHHHLKRLGMISIHGKWVPHNVKVKKVKDAENAIPEKGGIDSLLNDNEDVKK